MKNVSKNKFLTCFRPSVDIDATLESTTIVHRATNRRFACNSIDNRHDTKNSVAKSTFSDQKSPKLTQNWVVPHPPKRTLSKNTRARYINRYGQNCFGSKRGYSAYIESSSTGEEKKTFVETEIQEIKATELSSSKNLSKCESTKDKLEKQKKFQCLLLNLFLMSLAVTVLWGKINVVVLTSILLCLISLWNASCLRLKEVFKISHRDYNGRSDRKERLMGLKSFS